MKAMTCGEDKTPSAPGLLRFFGQDPRVTPPTQGNNVIQQLL